MREYGEGSHIPPQSPLFFMGQNKARGAMDQRREKIYGKSRGSRSQHALLSLARRWRRHCTLVAALHEGVFPALTALAGV